MAHCAPEVQAAWRAVLKERGVDVPAPEPGFAQEVESALKTVPGLFGRSQVTEEPMKPARPEGATE